MAKYLWRDEFCIGHAKIDKQHQQLFELLDKLYDEVCAGNADSTVEEVVSELVDYTRHHFFHEESMMRELNYPGLEKHQQEHQRLLQMVDEKMGTLRRGDKVMSIELPEFMNQWLTQHILKSDRELAQVLR
ncbi:MAG: bacteriohemerythrin [Halopseudomonas sp.]